MQNSNTQTVENTIIIKGDQISSYLKDTISFIDTIRNDGTSIQDYEDFLDLTETQKNSIKNKIEASLKNTNYKSQYKSLQGVITDKQAKDLAIQNIYENMVQQIADKKMTKIIKSSPEYIDRISNDLKNDTSNRTIKNLLTTLKKYENVDKKFNSQKEAQNLLKQNSTLKRNQDLIKMDVAIKKMNKNTSIRDLLSKISLSVEKINPSMAHLKNFKGNGILVGVGIALDTTVGGRPLPHAIAANIASTIASCIPGIIASAILVGTGVTLPVWGSIALGIGIFYAGSQISNFVSDKIYSLLNSASNTWRIPKDPIILDLDNNGITTSALDNAYFDFENDGFAELTSWIDDNDAMIVVDRNNNDIIDDGTEVLLHNDLLNYDSNNDGIIDFNDINFNDLKLLKGDGTLQTLQEAGVQSINLTTQNTDYTDDNGNYKFAEGTFTKSDGTTSTYGEYLLNSNPSQSIERVDIEISEEISALPNIAAMGKLHSLHIAMMQDNSENLKNLITNFINSSDEIYKYNLIDDILQLWVNTSNIDINSRGEYVNAQHLAILEKFIGESFWSTYEEENGSENPDNPNLNAGQIIETAYQKIKLYIYSQLMIQTELSDLYSKILIEPFYDKPYDLSLVVETLQQEILVNEENGKIHVLQFAKVLKGLGIDKFSNFFDPFDDDCFYTTFTENDRELKYLIDIIGTVSYNDETGEGEGTGADDSFRAEEDEDSHFHALTGDDVMYGDSGKDNFYACSGDDILDGGDGDDVLASHSGNDTIFGGAGNDIIQAADGDDIILGGDGDDLIYPDHSDDFNYANSGNDIIRGDKGNDTIFSMSGDDTFIFNLGDGQDIVYEKQGVDTFYFGNGITWDDLIFEQVGNDMIIKINNTSDQITVKDWFLTTGENYKYDNNKIEIFEFADGSKHYKDEITVGDNSESIVYNMSEIGDYVEIASGYKTKVYLKSGSNKILEGKNSNDTFILSEEGTNVLIQNYSGENTIQFGQGITL